VKYFVGDVIKLKDGLDYTGNSLSYQEGKIVEIMKIIKFNGNFLYEVRNFYRDVKEDEIEKLIYTNKEKWEKFIDKLNLIGTTVFVFEWNYEKKTYEIHRKKLAYFDFNYNDFTYKEGNNYYCIGEFYLSELEAWKSMALYWFKKGQRIREIVK
jgi:hypothetical protein